MLYVLWLKVYCVICIMLFRAAVTVSAIVRLAVLLMVYFVQLLSLFLQI